MTAQHLRLTRAFSVTAAIILSHLAGLARADVRPEQGSRAQKPNPPDSRLTITGPATISEGRAAAVTIRVWPALPSALEVTLIEARGQLSVPSHVVIPANTASLDVQFNAIDNSALDGKRTVAIQIFAADFPESKHELTILDDDPAAYRFAPVADIVNVDSPAALTVSPIDIDGQVIHGFVGNVMLNLVDSRGNVHAVSPSTVTLSAAQGWSCSVKLPDEFPPPARLYAADTNGISGQSTAFDVMRMLPIKTGDIIADPRRKLLYASTSAPAGAIAGDRVVAIDPATRQIVRDLWVGSDAGQLAITDGGEALYVAFNGGKEVAKIALDTFQVERSFEVGLHPTNGRVLRVDDICPVRGDPDVVLVSQVDAGGWGFFSVAAYDRGIMRPVRATGPTHSARLEPSTDPTLFFGYAVAGSNALSWLRLDFDGVREVAAREYLLGAARDIQTQGSMVFSGSGYVADGATLTSYGKLGVKEPRAVCPDLINNRVYLLDVEYPSWTAIDRVAAVDPTTGTELKRITFSPAVSVPNYPLPPARLLRIGDTGFAFSTETAILFIPNTPLVPTAAAVDLQVKVDVAPEPLSGRPFTYSVQVENRSANPAPATVLALALSKHQTIQSAAADRGAPAVAESNVTVALGALNPGEIVQLRVIAVPTSAGPLSASASANCDATDNDVSNNFVRLPLTAHFTQAPNSVSALRVPALQLAFDPSRNVLWASVAYSAEPPLAESIIAIDPTTGAVSEPIPTGIRVANSLAISKNGRYLYVARNDVPEVVRIDLASNPPTLAHIGLGPDSYGDPLYASSIQVLEGDGLSFIAVCEESARVYDGDVQRPLRTARYTASTIRPTSAPDTFIGFYNSIGGGKFAKLLVTNQGVSVVRTNSTIAPDGLSFLSSDGHVALGSQYPFTSFLVDTANLTLRATIPAYGPSAVDLRNGRVLLADEDYGMIRAFDPASGALRSSFALPIAPASIGWLDDLVCWGTDGFAVRVWDGSGVVKVLIGRWSSQAR